MLADKTLVLEALGEFLSPKESSMAHWEDVNASSDLPDYRTEKDKLLCELYKKRYITVSSYNSVTKIPYHVVTEHGLNLYYKLSAELKINI